MEPSYEIFTINSIKYSRLLFSCCKILSAGTTREHLGLAMALKVPIFIVVSKVDLCGKSTVEKTVRQLERVLKQPGCNKVPMVVANPDDAVTAAQQFAQSSRYMCVCEKREVII